MPSLQVPEPAAMAKVLFDHDHWSKPADFLRALFRPNARVIVKGCNASGKSFGAADAIVLTLITGGDALNTAPTSSQIEGVLWRQVRQAVADCKLDTSKWTVNLSELKLPTGEVALGRSTDTSVRFQGYHSRPGCPLLIVVDEAPGVIGEIMEAIGGISAGGDVRILMLGNPIIPSGDFYRLFASEARGWDRFTISAFDTPNLQGISIEQLLEMPDEELDADPRPYLATRRWVRDTYLNEGPDSPYWYSHVLGEFPLDDVTTLIPLAHLQQAQQVPSLYVPLDEAGEPLVAGIDVAGPGEDETCVVIRQGRIILETQSTTIPDSRLWATDILKSWAGRGLAQVNIDEIGNGWYFYQHVRDQFSGTSIRVTGINVQNKPITVEAQKRCANRKAELYWMLKDRFRDGQIGGLTDKIMIAQLGGIRYKDGDRFGRTVIESKERSKARGEPSPDRAEALMLAFADGPTDGIYTASIGQEQLLETMMGKGAGFVSSGRSIRPNSGRLLRAGSLRKFKSR